MQKLKFHPAWERTLSAKDRTQIESIFQDSKLSSEEQIQFTPVWQATNYKKELLITVLIHNTGKTAFTFDNQKMAYTQNGETIAESTFTLPVSIHEQTSMPWTFIFPTGSFSKKETYHSGTLAMKDF
ncbi:SLAP domain-containing protein [Virgibacillus kekensis]|uniref:SLAP domain-containing protein n=1 Tax=Virgibacillus kekensis TaxID=202261 RepID=A0ABV9DNN0_9BACI